jgi:hypothetical protein
VGLFDLRVILKILNTALSQFLQLLRFAKLPQKGEQNWILVIDTLDILEDAYFEEMVIGFTL